jgi:cytochrome oxidase Cu insertion factor (SCO1/SenC/PrrC family)
MSLSKIAARVCGSMLTATLVVGCGPTPGGPLAPGTGTTGPSPSQPAPEAACPECAAPSGPESSDGEEYRRSKWLAPGERGERGVLGLRVTDQDGKTHEPSDLCDRPTALSFVYTRCTNPNKCPRVVAEMARLLTLLEAEQLDSQVRLLVMTYDPEYDTPARLRQYGEKHGLRFTPHVMMVRPDSRENGLFFDRLRVAVNYDSSGVNLHGVQLFLFDREGRFVRRYQSVFWDNREVLGDLKRMTLEGPFTAPSPRRTGGSVTPSRAGSEGLSQKE